MPIDSIYVPSPYAPTPVVYDVRGFGAAGNGTADATLATRAAYDAARAATRAGTPAEILFPSGCTFLFDNAAYPQAFTIWGETATTAAPLTVRIEGTIRLTRRTYRFIDFDNADAEAGVYATVHDVRITGGGVIDGGGVANDGTLPALSHVLCGMYTSGGWAGLRCGLKNVLIEDLTITNVPYVTWPGGASLGARVGIGLVIRPYASNEATRVDMTGVTVRRIRIVGCNTGVTATGTAYVYGGHMDQINAWIDDVLIEDIAHDTGVDSTDTLSNSGHVQVGSRVPVGKVTIRRVRGYRAGDCGIEVDNARDALLEDCLVQDARGPSYLFCNFTDPLVPIHTQVTTLRNCRARRTLITNPYCRYLSVIREDTAAVPAYGITWGGDYGHVVVRDGAFESNQMQGSGSGLASAYVVNTPLNVASVTFDGFALTNHGWTHATAGTVVWNAFALQQLAQKTVLRNVRISLKGTTTAAATGTFQLTPIQFGDRTGGTTAGSLDIDGLDIDVDITRNAATTVAFTGIAIGGATVGNPSTFTGGSIRRFRIGTFTGVNSSTRGIIVRGTTAGTTLTGRLDIEACDGGALASAAGALLFLLANAAADGFGSENGDRVRARDCVVPNINTSIASAVVTPTASPFSYPARRGWSEDLAISGGTVSLVQVAHQGTSSLLNVGWTAGNIRLMPGDVLVVTYTVAPTIRAQIVV